MEQTFGPALLPVPILDSAEISHAAMRMMTVYELERPIGTAKTHKRCRANLDETMGQVEQLVRQSWGACCSGQRSGGAPCLRLVSLLSRLAGDDGMARKQSDYLADILGRRTSGGQDPLPARRAPSAYGPRPCSAGRRPWHGFSPGKSAK